MPDIFNPSSATKFGFELVPIAPNTFNLNAANNWFAGKIVAQANKNVTSLLFTTWGHNGAFQSLTVALYSDNAGKPGSLLQSGTITPAANFTYQSVSITSQAIVAGTTYWVVIHGATNDGTNNVAMRFVDDPDGLLCPSVFDCAESTDGGSTWTLQTKIAVVGLGFDDSTYLGCGYGDGDDLNIGNVATGGGANEYGELLAPTANIQFNQIAFKVKKSTSSVPSDDLHYYIYDITNNVQIESGTLVLAANVTTSYAWYTAQCQNTQLLKSGNTYSVGVFSSASSPNYVIRRPKTTGTGNSNQIGMNFAGTASCFVLGPNNISPNTSQDIPHRLTLTSSPLTLGSLGVGA